MGFGDLLRVGRVAQLGLRVVGRHRAATVVALVVAVGWLLMGATDARAVEPTPTAPTPTATAEPTTTPEPTPTATATVTETAEPTPAEPVCTPESPCHMELGNDQYSGLLLAGGLVVLATAGLLVVSYGARGN